MPLFSINPAVVYMIDSDNVNDNWTDIITDISKRDEVRIYYTEKSQNISIDKMALIKSFGANVETIECFTGANALDFTLVTELGYLIARNPRDKYIIISNDKGYEAAIKHWIVKEGIDVKRVSVDNSKGKKPKSTAKRTTGAKQESKSRADKPKQTRQQTKTNTAKPKQAKQQTKTNTAKPKQTKQQNRWPKPKSEQDYLIALGKSLSVKRLSEYNMALTQLFGQEKGVKLYHKVREDEDLRSELKEVYISDIAARQDNYIRLFMYKNKLGVSDSKKILSIIHKVGEDERDHFFKELIATFDEEKGRSYYNALGGSLRLIKRL